MFETICGILLLVINMKEIINAIELYDNRNEMQSCMDRLCYTYNPYASKRYTWTEVYSSVPQSIHPILDKYKCEEPYALIDYLIMKYGRGERVVKYHLAKKFFAENNVSCFFEYNVLGSRLDFGRINGFTYAYEIKTELDTLDRLEGQLENYSKVFDYIYVVVNEQHLKKIRKIINNKIGIMTYSIDGYDTEIIEHRPAKRNRSIQKKELIKLFNGTELSNFLIEKGFVPQKNIEARRKFVNRCASKDDLFEFFRRTLKIKYLTNWEFLKANSDRILPSDYQVMYANGLNNPVFRETLQQQLDSDLS